MSAERNQFALLGSSTPQVEHLPRPAYQKKVMAGSLTARWLSNAPLGVLSIISVHLFLVSPTGGQTYELGRSNGYQLRVEVIRDPPKAPAGEEPYMQTVKCRFIRIDENGKSMTWEEDTGAGFRVQVRVEDFLRRKRKQLWVAHIHGIPTARLFDFDGEKVTAVYAIPYEHAGRVYPHARINPGGSFEIFEEFDQEYEGEIFGPGLFNPETNLTERLIRWNGTDFVPVDVLKEPRAKQTARARKVNRYEQLLRSLAIGNSPSKVKDSRQSLKEAGCDAFPVLLEHLDDRIRVHPDAVPQQKSRITPDQQQTFQPTLGDACFEILQEVIEGRWPERFAPYHALNRINVGPWVGRNLRRGIAGFRKDAAEDALRFAREDPPQGIAPELHIKALEFLIERFEKLKQ